MIADFLKRAHRWGVPMALVFSAIGFVANQKHKTQCVPYVARAGDRGPNDPGGERMRHPGYNCIKCHSEGYTTETWVQDKLLSQYHLESVNQDRPRVDQ